VEEKSRIVLTEMRALYFAAAQLSRHKDRELGPGVVVTLDELIKQRCLVPGRRLSVAKIDAFGNPLPASFPWDRVPRPHPETMKILQQTLSPEQLKVFEATP
jgi:hypothetical protein